MAMAAQKRVRKTAEDNFEEALRYCEVLCEKPPKERKLVSYEFYRDPITGVREYHCPYRPTPRSAASCSANQVTSHDVCNITDESGSVDNNNECALELQETGYEEYSLEEALKKCDEILDSYVPPKRSWESRMTLLTENWDNCRKELLEAMVVTEGISYIDTCSVCQLQTKAVIRCIECRKTLCSSCDVMVHEHNPFHDRDVFLDGFFQPIPPTSVVDDSGSVTTVRRYLPLNSNHHCPSCFHAGTLCCIPASGSLIAVTQKGRFDLDHCSLQCRDCKTVVPSWSLGNIVKAGFWPGSPSDTSYLFDQKLFELWDSLQKRMPGTSENAFIRALEDFSQLKGRAPVINSTAFSRSFKEWKFCKHELTRLSCQDWMRCPPCAMDQHSCHVDGNMKLYRYKSSGVQKRPAYYEDLFIADKNDVDQHLQQIYSKQPKSKEKDDRCGDSHWRAANNKSKKNPRQDETGLELAGCRHGLALWGVNMYYGELYGYAHYIQKKHMAPAQVKYFWEDVVCKYWKWAQKVGLPGDMKPALSVMHAKAHSWNCQVIWGGRWQEGSACSTGEEVEQINSHFSRCGNTTKYMLPENILGVKAIYNISSTTFCRDELLTEHAFAWNRRKIIGMVGSLCKRYSRVSTYEQRQPV